MSNQEVRNPRVQSRDAFAVQESTPEPVVHFFEELAGDELEVAFLWKNQVISVERYGESVIVGDDARHDFVLEGISTEPWTLIDYNDADPSLHVHESMDVVIRRGQELWPLDECIESGLAVEAGGGWYQLELVDRSLGAQVFVGEFSFFVRFSQPMNFSDRRGSFDREPVPFVTMSAAAHIALLLIIMAMPDNAPALELDGFEANNRFVQLAMTPEQEEIEKPDWLDGAGNEEPEATAKHRGSEGKAGDPDAPDAHKKLAIEGNNAPEDIEVKKARDMQIASNAGIAAMAQISSIYGNANASVGADAQHALGNLEGNDYGASRGTFGLGVSCDDGADDCFGGGGKLEGSIGLANVKTRGKSSGRDYDRGEPDLGDHDGRVPGEVVNHQPPELSGGLDREIIQRVVRKHRREIKYCYEKELQKNRSLEGEVLVKFTILPTGRVVSSLSARSTLESPAVEGCMHSRIRRWVFPEPRGSGTVVVRYPFRFTPGG